MSDQPIPTSLDDLRDLLVGLRDGSAALRADLAGLRDDLGGVGGEIAASHEAWFSRFDLLDATLAERRQEIRAWNEK